MTELRHILYVEDDPDIREVAQMALSAVGGYRVTLSPSGAEALEMMRAELPDIVLLDVMMPGMDGPTTLRALREDPRTAPVPVVFVTAKIQRHEVEEYTSLGAVDVIAKPFDPMTLSAAVQAIWDNLT